MLSEGSTNSADLERAAGLLAGRRTGRTAVVEQAVRAMGTASNADLKKGWTDIEAKTPVTEGDEGCFPSVIVRELDEPTSLPATLGMVLIENERRKDSL